MRLFVTCVRWDLGCYDFFFGAYTREGKIKKIALMMMSDSLKRCQTMSQQTSAPMRCGPSLRGQLPIFTPQLALATGAMRLTIGAKLLR